MEVNGWISFRWSCFVFNRRNKQRLCKCRETQSLGILLMFAVRRGASGVATLSHAPFRQSHSSGQHDTPLQLTLTAITIKVVSQNIHVRTTVHCMKLNWLCVKLTVRSDSAQRCLCEQHIYIIIIILCVCVCVYQCMNEYVCECACSHECLISKQEEIHKSVCKWWGDVHFWVNYPFHWDWWVL